LISALKDRDVTLLTDTSVVRVDQNAVIVKNAQGVETALPADTIVVAAGYRSLNPLEEILVKANYKVQVVGDAKQARNVLTATTEGYLAGKAV
jgi:2-enoate reductase